MTSRLRCDEGLAGRVITIEGIGADVDEAVVIATTRDGEVRSHLVQSGTPRWTVPSKAASRASIAGEFVAHGLRHILSGWDHLLFLLSLVVMLRRARSVLIAETAFTLSHSVSFSLTALDLVRVSSAATEACIALSLVLAGAEALRAQGRPVSTRSAAGLAFVFGAVHGLGFAGGLREVGLPAVHRLTALAGFAAGVELGQLAVLLVLGVISATAATSVRWAPAVFRVSSYVVGTLGAAALVGRLEALFFARFP